MVLTVSLGSSVQDKATLIDMDSPTGTLTFTLYHIGSECTTPIYSATVSVSGVGDYYSGQYTPTCVGRYYWVVEYSGDGSNNPESGMCRGLSEAFDVTLPGCALILGTDNNYIVKRIGENQYCVVWAGFQDAALDPDVGSHDPDEFNAIAFGVPPTGTDSSKIATFASFNVSRVIYSQTAGDSWESIYPTPPTGYSVSGHNPVARDGNGLEWNVERDGSVLVTSSKSGSSGEFVLQSDNWYVDRYTEKFNASAADADPTFAMFMDNGLVWHFNPFATTPTLHRWDQDGSNYASWPIPGATDQGSLIGTPEADRLVAWKYNSTSSILLIDITNPTSPFTSLIANPFSPGRPIDIMPISNQQMVAYTTGTSSANGAIWLTEDGGTTWSKRVSNTTQLAPGEGQKLIALNYNNKREIYVAGAVPYVYKSTNGGSSWEVETVDLSLFEAPPANWMGVAVVCNPSGRARRLVQATLIGAS